jgi:hypothetical protein
VHRSAVARVGAVQSVVAAFGAVELTVVGSVEEREGRGSCCIHSSGNAAPHMIRLGEARVGSSRKD